jgi:hypothetical protein
MENFPPIGVCIFTITFLLSALTMASRRRSAGQPPYDQGSIGWALIIATAATVFGAFITFLSTGYKFGWC